MESRNQQALIHDEEIDLARVWGLLVDRRRLIMAATLGTFILALLYALLATPVYRADALLQVEEKQGGVPGFSELSEIFVQQSSAQTEIELIRSRMVLGEVIDQLHLDISVTRERWPLIGRLFGGGPPIVEVPPFASYADEEAALAVNQLEVPEALLDMPLILEVRERDFVLRDEDTPLLQGRPGKIATSTDGAVRLLVNFLEAPVGTEFVLTKRRRAAALQGMQSNLSVSETGRNTGVLRLAYTGPSPTRIKAILDGITEAYLMQNIKRLSAQAENSLEFLDRQLPDIKTDLQAAEDVLNEFRLKSESVDLPLETQAMLQRLVEVEARLNELTFKESEINRLFTPEHPAYRTLMEQRQSLKVEKERLNDLIKELPETQQQILRLTRNVQVNQEIYLQMLNKAQELRILKAGTVGNVRIIDNALVAAEPVRPRTALIVVLGTLLGLMGGVSFVLIKAVFHRGIESPEVLEQEGVPVYATVPKSEGQQRLAVAGGRRKDSAGVHDPSLLAAEEPGDLAVEALRSLRTSLHFAMLDAPNPVLMIAGPSPGIGKSFVAANLAVVLAQVEQRVVLIDADLRRGDLHDKFKVDGAQGLSGWLSGRTSYEDLVVPTGVPHLSLIPRGEAPPNPAELLMRERLPQLLERLSADYDLVIVDTPPVLAVTDATILGRHAGTTMMVARFGVTSLKEIHHAIKRFEHNGINVKGAVLNCIERRSGIEYGYYTYNYESRSGEQEER